MKQTITDYLKNKCDSDPELEEKFNENLIDGCLVYIEKKARDYLNDNNGAIKDEIVFGWARDYFVIGAAELDRIEKEKLEAERKEREAKREEERKKREEEARKTKEEKEREEAEKKFQEAQHADGQTSLLDIAGV